jgi:hypothetical protein
MHLAEHKSRSVNMGDRAHGFGKSTVVHSNIELHGNDTHNRCVLSPQHPHQVRMHFCDSSSTHEVLINLTLSMRCMCMNMADTSKK